MGLAVRSSATGIGARLTGRNDQWVSVAPVADAKRITKPSATEINQVALESPIDPIVICGDKRRTPANQEK